LDNLKAAVLKADWFDPEINPKLADFCRHYRIHVMPCRPAKPQHKGKVERGVAYLRTNALKGRRFKSLAEENLFLACWESQVADKRIHGTTRKQVAARFEQERPYLQALPESFLPSFQKQAAAVAWHLLEDSALTVEDPVNELREACVVFPAQSAVSIATVTSKWHALITKFRPNSSATRSGSDGTVGVSESSTRRWNRFKSIAVLNRAALATS